uniref:Uncharacterized protein n=1 Tax=Nelumbo nucifera TaxID=4432 RepID=A0A822YJG8_NELNU|nr:TPA_asm: hypothetical protein HUJ06_009976 [Nelumbo nucifera]
MPPPPPPPPLLSVTLLFVILRLLAVDLTVAHTCSPTRTNITSCPPFTSPPSFPFSSSPGCGHPSFQILCSSNRSFISINNFSFVLLRHDPNSSTLVLSPQSYVSDPTHRSCPSASLPDRAIDLSGSPFRFSDAPCARLSVLRQCNISSLPNCSRCPWDCKLLKSPVQLLKGCSSKHRSSEQGCQQDVLDYLHTFLNLGIQVQWDESNDTYFSRCKDCQSEDGVCGFNTSDTRKPFRCFSSRSRISSHSPH